MANTITSPLMSLPIPVPGVDPGPDYAFNLNSCLALIDSHDHSPGKGNPITPAGMSISSDLSFLGNNITQARSLRFQSQPSVLSGTNDLGCLYEVNGDLYFNDGSANHVRITQSGGVAGSPGSISNLTSPASASYIAVNSAFVWQSAANTPAIMDSAAIILRNLSAGSKGLTLQPPAAMGGDIVQTLPTIPGSQTSIMQMDTSGNMSASLNVDNSTLQITSNVMSVKGSLTQAMKAPMTLSTNASVGQMALSNPAAISGTATGNTPTGLTVTISTSGRPVILFLTGDYPSSPDCLIRSFSASGSVDFILCLQRADIPFLTQERRANIFINGSSAVEYLAVPPSSYGWVDFPAAGTYTYNILYRINTNGTFEMSNIKLCAYEL